MEAQRKPGLWQDTCSSLPYSTHPTALLFCTAPTCPRYQGEIRSPALQMPHSLQAQAEQSSLAGPGPQTTGSSVQLGAWFQPEKKGQELSISAASGDTHPSTRTIVLQKILLPQTVDSSVSFLRRHGKKGPQGREKIWVLPRCDHFLAEGYHSPSLSSFARL